ncbi:MAG: hypothetical protein ABUS79_05750 [Pseudomonadota bacterium]
MSLPGPPAEVELWRRTAVVGAALRAGAAAESAPAPAGVRTPPDLAGLRSDVAAVLKALAWRVEEQLPRALAAAPQAWDRVDDLLGFFDPALTAHVADVRRRLELAAAGGAGAAARAAGIEGLLVIEAAWGMARLCERRLSSLIRLRVRSGDEDLLPGGRPFLDLAGALREAARAWA